MKMRVRKFFSAIVFLGCLLLSLIFLFTWMPQAASGQGQPKPAEPPVTVALPSSQATATASPQEKAHAYLADVMDQYHRTFDVYTDVGAAGNHFVYRGEIGSVLDQVTNDDAYTDTVHSGATAISATFKVSGNNWGGFYYQNGILQGDDHQPGPNWGTVPDAGVDLTGATHLTFWARGAQGGERVEFFAFNVGRNASGQALNPYPDSAAKATMCERWVTQCYTTLEATWRAYTITLTGLDLSYVLGGFGWVTNAPQNSGHDIEFYLDDIRYDKAHLADLRLLQSFATLPAALPFDELYRNTAFTYDNALALIAFTARSDQARAQLLADALVYAQAHDRFYDDGRLRNCYQAGDLILPPGWTPHGRVGTARMSGWWQDKTWTEDEECVGSATGNLAWAMIALLDYYDRFGGATYLAAATQLGQWIELNASDTRGAGGYTGGYKGWEPTPEKLLWKSTEHNLDLYAAFSHLGRITQDAVWNNRAEYARHFVETMWNSVTGFYRTGTLDDGVTINQQAIPLDAQSWAMQAFGANDRTRAAMAYATAHHHATWGGFEGFDFDTDQDQPWPEGTGQMVVSYDQMGDAASVALYRAALRKIQQDAAHGDGRGLVSAPKDELTTGFSWLYYNRLHVGATAWFIFAERGYNPYAGGVEPPPFGMLDIGLSQTSYGSVAWGDYDNDGRLDFVRNGCTDTGPWKQCATGIYHNNGDGTFSAVNAGLPATWYSAVAWGDLDNDGWLDVLLSVSDDAYIYDSAHVYHNNGDGTFSDRPTGLPGWSYGSVALGDYDSDGWTDFAVVGDNGAYFYHNNGDDTFSRIDAGLSRVALSAVAWGDYDNDGDLDLLLAGTGSGSDPASLITRIYRHNGDGTFSDLYAGLPGVSYASVAWGDYDNDGWLDILLAGSVESWDDPPITRVYHNNGNGTFTDIQAGLPGIVYGQAIWGDYDNDGRLDIFVDGAANIFCASPLARVYHNDGDGAFSDIGAGLPGMLRGWPAGAAWGDYDNDGWLDLLVSSEGGAGIFHNNTATANLPPAPPAGLSVTVSGAIADMRWSAANDGETPANGLSYNIRIGTTPGGSQVVSPLALTGTGYRLIPALGNAGQRQSATLQDLAPDTRYYWSVQAIDTAFAGSPFATERSFMVPSAEAIRVAIGVGATHDAVIQWQADPQYVSYELWRHTTPYFGASPATATLIASGLPPAPNCTSQGATIRCFDPAASGAANSSYYLVKGLLADDAAVLFTRVGRFGFAIEAGQ